MYKWDKNIIDNDIKYLNDSEIKNEYIIEDIETLKELKKGIINKTNIKYELYVENFDYKQLKKYNVLLNPIIKKYIEYKSNYDKLKLKKIETSKEDILLFTQDIIHEINKKWYKTLLPIFNDINILNYKKNNNDFIVPLTSINKYYISLGIKKNIRDFINPVHEYLHIYNHILNSTFIHHLENEFLSIFGELIVAYELSNKNIFKTEIIKSSLSDYSDILYFIKDINLRKYFIKNKFTSHEKIDYITNIYDAKVKDVYNESLLYHYDTIISYFIAIELFEIYLQDKEKCMFICDQLILDNSFLTTKLKKYNITLLNSDDEYIKKLKKEYTLINSK